MHTLDSSITGLSSTQKEELLREKNLVIDALRRELTYNLQEVEKLKHGKEELIQTYEERIEQTRRATRESV